MDKRPICRADGCGSAVLAKELCGKHYQRMRATGQLERPRRTGIPCSECGRVSVAKGLCDLHYRRVLNPRGKRGVLHHGRVCAKCQQPIPPERRGDAIYCSAICKNRALSVKTQRRFQLKRKYGLTEESFAALLASQDYRCAICRTDQPGHRGAWHVDHDHKTGRVRGLLCGECNNGIGKLKDDPKVLIAALVYLTGSLEAARKLLR